MIPTIDGGSCALGALLVSAAAVVTVCCLVAVVAVLRRRLRAMPAFLTGIVYAAPFAAFLFVRTSMSRSLDAWAIALFLVPVFAALLLMTVALGTAARDGMRGAKLIAAGGTLVVVIAAAVLLVVTGLRQKTVDRIRSASTRGDGATVRALLPSLRDGDGRVRRELLVRAAHYLDVDLMKTLIDGGADPNGEASDFGGHPTTPLIAAVRSGPWVFPETMTHEEFRRRQWRAVVFLLKHGADAGRRSGLDRITAADAARDSRDGELEAVLRAAAR